MVWETKKLVEWMCPRIEQLDALFSLGSIWWEEYKPLNIIMNANISFIWKWVEEAQQK